MFTHILTMGQVLPWIPSQSCMHMGTCAKGRFGARAHKAILYKILHMLGKIKQTIRDALRALYAPYCLGSRLMWPLASRRSLGGKVVLSNDHVLVHIESREAIVELAPKWNIA